MSLYIAIPVSLFVLAGLGWFYLNRTMVYGWIGEFGLRKIYLRRLPEEYVIINDLLLETADGRTHQIDHVIVSPYGIFVLETKAYMGKIYGSQYSPNWTEYLAGTGYEFYNPIRQNYGHKKALAELTNLPERAFIPIVVFGRAARLRVQIDNDKGGEVIQTPKLVATIESYKEELITDQTQRKVIKLLEDNNIQGKEARKQHIERVREAAKSD